MTDNSHRAWKLTTAKLTADTAAERELNRDVGEGTYDWYELAHELADVVAAELRAQLAEGQFSALGLTDDMVLVWLQWMSGDDSEDAA
jgi:hypothetical protein